MFTLPIVNRRRYSKNADLKAAAICWNTCSHVGSNEAGTNTMHPAVSEHLSIAGTLWSFTHSWALVNTMYPAISEYLSIVGTLWSFTHSWANIDIHTVTVTTCWYECNYIAALRHRLTSNNNRLSSNKRYITHVLVTDKQYSKYIHKVINRLRFLIHQYTIYSGILATKWSLLKT